MMRRGESFHGIAGGGRFWLELVRTCPCLSVSIRHSTFVKLIQSKKKKKENGGKAGIKLREEVDRKYERERTREKGELEELEGRLSYIGRRSCVCITRE